MPSAQHGLEMTSRGFPDSTKINMNDHKYGKDKSCNYMHEIGEVQTACSENLLNKYYIWKDQRPAGDKDQGHKEIKYGKVRHLLKRIELSPAIDGIRGFFTAEDAKNVITKLHRYFFFQPSPSHPVIKTIFREHVSEKDHQVVDSE